MKERSWRRPSAGIALLLPLALLVLVVLTYPSAHLIGQAFTTFDAPQRAGLDNFRWLFGDPTYVSMVVRTFAIAAAVSAICVVVGYPYAYVMTIVSPRRRLLMLVAVLSPYFTSLTMRNFSWLVLLGREGLLNDVFGLAGWGPVELLGTWKGAFIGMCHLQMPLAILPLYAVLRGIDRQCLAVAQSLGAHPAMAFLRIYLPLSSHGIAGSSLLTFIASLGFFITPALLGSPQDAMLAQLIDQQALEYVSWGRAGAASLVLIGGGLVLLAPLALIVPRRRLSTAAGR